MEQMPTKWNMEGALLGACSCDWGCPCSFNAPPTRGFCEGCYVWHVEKGSYGDVPLQGLSLAWAGQSPGPMHLGNVSSIIFIDEKADAAQRAALETICRGKSGGPWTILAAVTARFFGPKYSPFELHLDGLNSTARVSGLIEMELGPILNPVTGQAEELYLDKPTGFTSLRAALGAGRVFRVTSDLVYDHSGKYGEFSKFSYSGEPSN